MWQHLGYFNVFLAILRDVGFCVKFVIWSYFFSMNVYVSVSISILVICTTTTVGCVYIRPIFYIVYQF